MCLHRLKEVCCVFANYEHGKPVPHWGPCHLLLLWMAHPTHAYLKLLGLDADASVLTYHLPGG